MKNLCCAKKPSTIQAIFVIESEKPAQAFLVSAEFSAKLIY
jgi:hypothetical protein